MIRSLFAMFATLSNCIHFKLIVLVVIVINIFEKNSFHRQKITTLQALIIILSIYVVGIYKQSMNMILCYQFASSLTRLVLMIYITSYILYMLFFEA